ncbi:hypothetical protein AGMMS49944_13590 [Spirochaetia bacterium]|nr:hypothetical protein AGMMS49944_13590 [Spirochaetia bacterium]
MKLVIKKIINREICHYANDTLLITSKANCIFVDGQNYQYIITIPINKLWKKIAVHFRIFRRVFRLDKMNVIPVENGFCIIYQGVVWHYDTNNKKLLKILRLENCRNLLHQSVTVLDSGKTIYFGEYGANKQRAEVPVWRSLDGGKSWHKVFVFPAGKIKHIHGCYYDPVEDKIWTLTGDFAGECYLLCSDRDFHDVEWVGNGQQESRAVNAFFEYDSIHWIMDSQLQDSYHILLDRSTRKLEQKSMFPGPAWYSKKLSDGYYLVTTAVEIGVGVHDEYAHILLSKDLNTWEDIFQFRHDHLPKRYFKWGVLAFADGEQSSQEFYIFGEALKGLDGKIAICQLN